jgi:hypothetical protein
MSAKLLLLANLAPALYMTGVIWFVQLVHYPLFAAVPRESFLAYEARHRILTTFVVAPAMLLELGASLLFAYSYSRSLPHLAASALTLVVWGSTFFIQVPLHESLSNGFSPETIRNLVASNWIRTLSWTLRSLILLGITARWLNEQT